MNANHRNVLLKKRVLTTFKNTITRIQRIENIFRFTTVEDKNSCNIYQFSL